MNLKEHLLDERATVAFGKKLGQALSAGAVVFMSGTLGAGKTTATRGILQGLGYPVSAAVKSPTYTLVEPYELNGVKVFHFDLYRLGDPEELEYMGIRDYFTKKNVCVVEWPVRGNGYLPKADLDVALTVAGQGREVSVTSQTPRGDQILQIIK